MGLADVTEQLMNRTSYCRILRVDTSNELELTKLPAEPNLRNDFKPCVDIDSRESLRESGIDLRV